MVAELKGPLNSQLKQFIIDNKLVTFKLVNGDVITGKVVWLDPDAIFIEKDDSSQLTIMRSSIIYFSQNS